MWNLIARLACRGVLRLLDGGNRFDVYRCNLAVGHTLGGQTADYQLFWNAFAWRALLPATSWWLC